MMPSMARLGQRMGQLPIWTDRPFAVTFVSAALVFLAVAVRVVADGYLPSGFPFLTFFPVIVVIAFLFGLRAGASAAVICGAIAWYWFVPPTRSWALNSGGVLAMLFYSFVVVTDLTIIKLMQMANRTLRHERVRIDSLVENRDLLFRELQHRVSNNLQMVASLINLQRSRNLDPHVDQSLADASRRIATIGRTTRSIYKANASRRPLDEFVRQVCDDFAAINGRSGVSIIVTGESQCTMASDDAVPIALVITECLANAFEHAFPDQRRGTATVTMTPTEDGATIAIHDNGVGLPAGFDLEATESLGLLIARALSVQVGGTLTMTSARDGTTASFAVRDARDAVI